jgi:hypothetical protein
MLSIGRMFQRATAALRRLIFFTLALHWITDQQRIKTTAWFWPPVRLGNNRNTVEHLFRSETEQSQYGPNIDSARIQCVTIWHGS